MDRENKQLSRKKFLFLGISAGSLLAIPSFFRSPKKKKNEKTAKMLTEDGRLVEIDLSKIPGKKEKIKPQDVHTWVKKSRTL